MRALGARFAQRGTSSPSPWSALCAASRAGRLVVEPPKRPRYTLDELLAQCDFKARRTKEDREWLDNQPAGRELI